MSQQEREMSIFYNTSTSTEVLTVKWIRLMT